MAKLTLPDIGTLANTESARQAINDNFTDVETAIENTLSRDGSTPNQMEADIDLNSNDILNVGNIDVTTLSQRGVPVAFPGDYDSVSGTLFPEGVGSIPRPVRDVINEHWLSLKSFDAKGDGTTNDTAAFSAWLTALSEFKRPGYIPEGTYLIDGIRKVNLNDINIKAHHAAKIKGTRSYQNFAGDGTTGQEFTVTDFGLTFGTLRATRVTSTGVQEPLTETTHFTISGLTVKLAGTTVIAVGDTIRIVSSEPMLDIRSTGSTTTPAGAFSWEGGYFDASERGYVLEQGTGGALSVSNWNKHNLYGVTFYAAEDYVTGAAAGVGDTGYTPLQCYNGTVTACLFQGWGDLGIYATGGADKLSASDDGVGLVLQGNHFVKCAAGWKASRQIKNVVSNGNTYNQCWIGAALFPASDVRAGRGSITNERFYRCGRNAIDIRQQVGCAVANNVIIDLGYLPDGVTSATTFLAGGHVVTAINMLGCVATSVNNNTIIMDELASPANSYGIRNLEYLFDSVTSQPTNNTINDNYIQGMTTCIQENGSGGGSRYRNNEFRVFTTGYTGIPDGRLPYGTYVPTLTNQTNISASTPISFRFRRHDGDRITVDFDVDIDLVADATPSELRISIPIPVATSDAHEIQGQAFSDVVNLGARIASIGATNMARMFMRPPAGADLGNRRWTGYFTYRAAPQ